ncbi:hypothetical protein [Paenibacillus silvisoli]|uniref:hypothetical protein n=1 Tax=Paenibacillus silvisoli TaxID=3110539 RepID=UPI0028049380|nr:hypothetical protein [Paenibacillus silvisoli]
MWHKTCRGSTYTAITGNLYIDLFIIMLIGLVFIGISFPGLYAEYKDVRQEENRILRIIGALLLTVSFNLGGVAIGGLLFLLGAISLIGEWTC